MRDANRLLTIPTGSRYWAIPSVVVEPGLPDVEVDIVAEDAAGAAGAAGAVSSSQLRKLFIDLPDLPTNEPARL